MSTFLLLGSLHGDPHLRNHTGPNEASLTGGILAASAFRSAPASPRLLVPRLAGSGRANLSSRESVAALRFMLELGRYAPRAYVSFGADEVSAHLLQGTAAQSINWPAWIPAMDDARKSRVAGKIAFTTMPSAARPGAAERSEERRVGKECRL